MNIRMRRQMDPLLLSGLDEKIRRDGVGGRDQKSEDNNAQQILLQGDLPD